SSVLFALPTTPENPVATDIRFGGGLLFSDIGIVANPETMDRVTQLPVAGLVAVDPVLGRVFYLSSTAGGWVLHAFDMGTFQQVWFTPVPGASGNAGNLVSCGAGLLAFRTTMDQLFLINTTMFSNTPVPNLVVSQSVTPNPAVTNAPVVFTVTVSNAGPVQATGVVLTSDLPSGPH